VQGLGGVVGFLAICFVVLVYFGEVLLSPFRKIQVLNHGAMLVRCLREFVSNPLLFGSVVFLSALIHMASVLVVITSARAMEIPLQPLAGIVLTIPTLLIMMMPISIAGWGIREGAMIVALGYAGVKSSDAFAISVAFGLIYVLAGIPGGVLWLSGTGGSRRNLSLRQDGNS
jgi:uncharacterized membrane protein YbhN (UPF0104 family)